MKRHVLKKYKTAFLLFKNKYIKYITNEYNKLNNI